VLKEKREMKITKGTITRSVLLFIVVLNMLLKKMGLNPLIIDKGTTAYFVETILELLVIMVSFWKNNSFSKNAIRADEFLKALREGEEI
jgi:SPP1 family holin